MIRSYDWERTEDERKVCLDKNLRITVPRIVRVPSAPHSDPATSPLNDRFALNDKENIRLSSLGPISMPKFASAELALHLFRFFTTNTASCAVAQAVHPCLLNS